MDKTHYETDLGWGKIRKMVRRGLEACDVIQKKKPPKKKKKLRMTDLSWGALGMSQAQTRTSTQRHISGKALVNAGTESLRRVALFRRHQNRRLGQLRRPT